MTPRRALALMLVLLAIGFVWHTAVVYVAADRPGSGVFPVLDAPRTGLPREFVTADVDGNNTVRMAFDLSGAATTNPSTAEIEAIRAAWAAVDKGDDAPAGDARDRCENLRRRRLRLPRRRRQILVRETGVVHGVDPQNPVVAT